MAAKPKKDSDEAEIAAWNKKLAKRREEQREARENVTTSRTKKGSGDD
tara:strand:+ start:3732 stop:3875 length:144 start_codon:yes stop_codon:yes gene_type:complete